MEGLVERLRHVERYGYIPHTARQDIAEAVARIAELESWKAAEDAHHHMLTARIAELEAQLASPLQGGRG